MLASRRTSAIGLWCWTAGSRAAARATSAAAAAAAGAVGAASQSDKDAALSRAAGALTICAHGHRR